MARKRNWIEAIGYMRTSSAANLGRDKDSEKRQRAAIEGYAKAAGYVVAEWFYDAADAHKRLVIWIDPASRRNDQGQIGQRDRLGRLSERVQHKPGDLALECLKARRQFRLDVVKVRVRIKQSNRRIDMADRRHKIAHFTLHCFDPAGQFRALGNQSV
jgi:hypothetical protein